MNLLRLVANRAAVFFLCMTMASSWSVLPSSAGQSSPVQPRQMQPLGHRVVTVLQNGRLTPIATTTLPNVIGVQGYSTMQYAPPFNRTPSGALIGLPYNITISYDNGTSVNAYVAGGSLLRFYHFACGYNWANAYNVKFNVGKDANVYIVATKIANSLPTKCSSLTPAQIQFAKMDAANLRAQAISGQRAIVPFASTCDYVSQAAAAIGAVVGSAASVDLTIGVGVALGTLLGPEGSAAAYIFGSWAVAQYGVATLGSAVGTAVFGMGSLALCEAIGSNGEKTRAKDINDPYMPDAFADTSFIGDWGNYHYWTAVYCCEPYITK